MSLFDTIFKKEKIQRQTQAFFRTLSAYTPVFTTFEGGVYEMALTRAAIHAFATQVSKLKPEVSGPGNKQFERMLQYRPNPYQDTSKFLYRLATIYSVRNNAIIAPLYDDAYENITGYFPLLPQNCKVVEAGGIPYLRYQFAGGQWGANELSEVGIMAQMQYKDDLFGEDNRALIPTLQAIDTQNQGIIEGIKNSATIRFLGRLANTYQDKTIEAERNRFKRDNLGVDNNNGILLVDAKYADVKQIDSQPFLINAAQMKEIKENVYSYFGCNDKILQNSFGEDDWNAYYEGKIEPFAIQLSLVMSNMTFSQREIAFNNRIMFTANRLQYASNNSKLNIVTQLFDRGMITRNMGLEVFNMAPLEAKDGDKYYIRKDYAEVNELSKGGTINAVQTGTAGVPKPASAGSAEPTEPQA